MLRSIDSVALGEKGRSMVNLGSRAHDVLPGPCTPQELGVACERHGVRCVQLALGKSGSERGEEAAVIVDAAAATAE